MQKDLEGGLAFTSAASTHSDDAATKTSGGNMGLVRSEDLPVAIALKVRTMKKGDMTLPIGTREGYQIVKVLSDPEIVMPDFETVKPKIVAKLRYEAKTEELSRLLQKAALSTKAGDRS